MEFRYTIEPVTPLVRVRCWGVVTPKKLSEMVRHIGADASYRLHLPVLVDLREAKGAWDYSDSQSFRDFLVRIGDRQCPVRWAVVLRPGELAAVCHVTMVITQAVDCGISIRLFEDLDAASEWVLAGTTPALDDAELSTS